MARACFCAWRTSSVAIVAVLAVLSLPTALGATNKRQQNEITATNRELLYPCDEATALDEHLQSDAGQKQIDLAFARVHGARMLADAEALPCAMIQNGWWHYELCWNRYVRQFHPENNRIATEFFLGVGPLGLSRQDRMATRFSRYADGDRSPIQQIYALRSSAQWRAVEGNLAAKQPHNQHELAVGDGGLHCSRWLDARHKQLQFDAIHRQSLKKSSTSSSGAGSGSQTPGKPTVQMVQDTGGRSPAIATLMTAGSICDKTNMPRRTLVVLTCEHEFTHYLSFNVSEDVECSYVVYVYGAAICSVLAHDPELPFPTAMGAPAHGQRQPQTPTKKSGKTTVSSDATKRPAPSGSRPTTVGETAAKRETDEAPIGKPSRYAVGDKTQRGSQKGASQKGDGDGSKSSRALAERYGDADDDDEPPPLWEGSDIFSL